MHRKPDHPPSSPARTAIGRDTPSTGPPTAGLPRGHQTAGHARAHAAARPSVGDGSGSSAEPNADAPGNPPEASDAAAGDAWIAASPLWPLAVVLGDIARRVCRHEAEELTPANADDVAADSNAA